MDLTIFVGVLVIVQCLCLWASQRASNQLINEEDYFLAGKNVKFFPLLMTFIATQIGGGLVLGASEEAYQYGLVVILYPLGASLGFLVLALGVGRKLAQFKVSTIAELMEQVYQSVLLKKIASLLSIISLFMILIAQVIASRKFMMSLGLSNEELFLLFWAVVILYTVLGGLKAVVSIDIIQASFFIGIFVLTLGYIFYTGSFVLTDVISEGLNTELFSLETSKLSGWLLMPLLFMVIEQDMAQRCFAAQSPKVVTKAAAYSALCLLLISIIPIFVGVLGKYFNVPIAPNTSVFMEVIQFLTSPAITAFVGCAVLMAILSTAISLLNAVSSNVTQDFNLNVIKSISSVRLSQGLTALIGILAIFSSFYVQTILDLLIKSYELSVYCLFIPVCAALIKKQGNACSAWLAILFGGIAFCFFSSWMNIPKEILCVSFSGLGFVIGEIYSKQVSKKEIQIPIDYEKSIG